MTSQPTFSQVPHSLPSLGRPRFFFTAAHGCLERLVYKSACPTGLFSLISHIHPRQELFRCLHSSKKACGGAAVNLQPIADLTEGHTSHSHYKSLVSLCLIEQLNVLDSVFSEVGLIKMYYHDNLNFLKKTL